MVSVESLFRSRNSHYLELLIGIKNFKSAANSNIQQKEPPDVGSTFNQHYYLEEINSHSRTTFQITKEKILQYKERKVLAKVQEDRKGRGL